jgi:hypothetical protein
MSSFAVVFRRETTPRRIDACHLPCISFFDFYCGFHLSMDEVSGRYLYNSTFLQIIERHFPASYPDWRSNTSLS